MRISTGPAFTSTLQIQSRCNHSSSSVVFGHAAIKPRHRIGWTLPLATLLTFLQPLATPVSIRQAQAQNAPSSADALWVKAIAALSKGESPFGGADGLTNTEIRQIACQDSGERPNPPTSTDASSIAAYLTPRTIQINVGITTSDNPLEEHQGEALGSGWNCLVDGNTVIAITSAHVIDPKAGDEKEGEKGKIESLQVVLSNGRKVPAKVLAEDRVHDNAILAYQKPADMNIPTLPFALQNPQQGDWVATMGNPEGLGWTFTHGDVSNPSRDGLGPNDKNLYIQTTAPFTFGNSGGPMVNQNGGVVGKNNNIISGDPEHNLSNALLNFANHADTIARDVVATRLKLPISKPMLLGIMFGHSTLQDLSASIMEMQHAIDSNKQQLAGLQSKLEAFRKTHKIPDEDVAIMAKNPMWGGLDSEHQEEAYVGMISTLSFKLQESIDQSSEALTDQTQLLDTASANRVNDKSNGTVIQQVQTGSLADKAGLKRGDIITQIDGEDVNSQNMQYLVARHFAFEPLSLTIQRNHKSISMMLNQGGVRELQSGLATIMRGILD
jgi:serine protease Do